jgi:hypothetical protein
MTPVNTSEPPPTQAARHAVMVGYSVASTIPPKESIYAVLPAIMRAERRNQNARPSGRVSLEKIGRQGLLGQRNPRSTIVTGCPAWARRRAVMAPPKPDPITRLGV